jgi:hypothetical protein
MMPKRINSSGHHVSNPGSCDELIAIPPLDIERKPNFDAPLLFDPKRE